MPVGIGFHHSCYLAIRTDSRPRNAHVMRNCVEVDLNPSVFGDGIAREYPVERLGPETHVDFSAIQIAFSELSRANGLSLLKGALVIAVR